MNSLIQSNNNTSGSSQSVKHRNHSMTVQPKLTVNTPGDRYEQEADAMADHVMRMPANTAEQKPVTGLIGRSVQRKCAACEEEEKKKRIMRKESIGSGDCQFHALLFPL